MTITNEAPEQTEQAMAASTLTPLSVTIPPETLALMHRVASKLKSTATWPAAAILDHWAVTLIGPAGDLEVSTGTLGLGPIPIAMRTLPKTKEPLTVTRVADDAVDLGFGRTAVKSLHLDSGLPKPDRRIDEEIAPPFSVSLATLERMATAALNDDSRAPQLTAICFGAGRIVTTDSYRLMVASFPAYTAEQRLMPAQVVAVLRALAGPRYEGTVDLAFGERHGCAVVTGTDGRAWEVRFRPVGGQFPDVDRLIPEGFGYRITLPSAEAIKEMAAEWRWMIGAKGDVTCPVRLNEDGSIRLVTADRGTWVREGILETDFPGTVAFNPSYLAAGVDVVCERSDQRPVLKLNSQYQPSHLTGEVGGVEVNYLLMPVRV